VSGRNQSLVVGLDGSDGSLVALEWAAGEASRRGWSLILVNAFPVEVQVVAYIARLPIAEPGGETAERIFAVANRRLAERGYTELTVSTVAREGVPRRVLLQQAEETRGLVVGRQGTGRLADLFIGSTSLACATHSAGTPVTVIPASWQPAEPGEQRERVIVVGVDGSRRGRHAVEYAFTTASAWGARVRAVLAYDVATDARRFLSEALAGHESAYPDVRVSPVTEADHPAAVIRKHSDDADLVVIGGRGHSELTGMLLGSVARSVLYLVDRPTAVVHEPARTRRRTEP
jgi:nucleotide-binding universal stress UspA family protein